MKIAYCTERKATYRAKGFSEEQCAEFNEASIDAVVSGLRDLGHDVVIVGELKDVVLELAASDFAPDWDLVYNDASGIIGSAREAQVPALLEACEIPFTYSNASTYTISSNKVLTKVKHNVHRRQQS